MDKLSVIFGILSLSFTIVIVHSNVKEKIVVVNGTDSVVRLGVKSLHFTKFENTTFHENIQWTYLHTPTTTSLLRCGRSCLDTTNCSGFFYNTLPGESPNCFINDKVLRNDHRIFHENQHYYEVTVSAFFLFKKNTRILANTNVIFQHTCLVKLSIVVR